MTSPVLSPLTAPVAVFDAGIGSYAAVDRIHRAFPEQDIVYLADRASFPYGGKSLPELRTTIERTLDHLEALDPAPSAIVVASNVPSVTVLDETVTGRRTPVVRVVPPVREALEKAGEYGEVAVLGVTSLVTSEAIVHYVDRESGPARSARVRLRDASALVELVESGAFLFEPEGTLRTVAEYVARLRGEHPAVRVATLSSTHLPWLRPFLEEAAPDLDFLDPGDSVIAEIAPHTRAGSGSVVGLVTETPDYPADRFREMLARIGVEIPLVPVTIA
ncbi:glutamate racemase [Streptomyces sp. NPDC055808]